MLALAHIGYAIKNMRSGIDAFLNLGYEFTDIVHDEARNVQLSFGTIQGTREGILELVSPGGVLSPVDRILQSIGNTPYHLCYLSDSFSEDVRKLEKAGFKLIDRPSAAIAFGGRRVCFLFSRHIGIIEILEN